MYNSDIVLLTGAGASIPVGIPGMAGMAKEFQENLSNNSDESVAHELLRDLKVSEDVEELLQITNFLIEFPEHTVNDFVESCIAPRGGEGQLQNYRSRRDSEVKKINKLRDKLLKFITTKCLKFDREKSESIYKDLVRILSKNDIPVYTTNYDAVFDYTADLNNIPIVDNFIEDNFRREYWDSSLNSFYGDGLKLIKIHGSIQWHATKDGRIEKLSQPSDVNQEGEELRQLLIFPTRFKDIYTQNYFPLYSSFTRTLGQSKVLIIIGHSLRDEYLLAAIRDRLRDQNFRLIMIAPDFPLKSELIESNKNVRKRILHIKLSIEDVFPLLIQILDDFKVDNIFKHLDEAFSHIRHHKNESLKLDPYPRWISENEVFDTTLKVESLIGGEVKFKMYSTGKKNRRFNLNVEVTEEQDNLSFFGMKKLSIPITIKLPNSIPDGKYTLHIELLGHNGKISAEKQYSLDTRKEE